MSESNQKIPVFGEFESRVVNGFVVDKNGVRGISEIEASIAAGDITQSSLNSTTNEIELKNSKGTVVCRIPAAPFIKDGMLQSVVISEGNLVFTFNEDGIDPISIPLTDIFNPSNFYNKEQVDEIAKTSETITVAGGPLADDTSDNWPTDWKDDAGNRIIPEGVTLQEALMNLFLKVINGTVTWGTPSWNPSIGKPTATLSSNGPVEVGTEVTATVAVNNTVSGNTRSATCTASQGHFLTEDGEWQSGNKTVSKAGTTSGSNALSCKWNNTTTAITSGTTKLKVIEGTNTLSVSQSGMSAAVDALPSTKVYASTNTKKVLSDVSATLSDTKPSNKALTSSNSDTIVGYYRWNAMAAASNAVTATASTWKFTDTASIASVSIPDGEYLVILVPSGYSLKTATQLTADFTGSLASETVELTIGGGSKHTYTKYYWKNTSGSAAAVDNITIGK